MNQMFLNLLTRYSESREGHIAHGIRARPGASIPEMEVIKRNLSNIADRADVDHVRVKLCITGPYTLSLLFKNRDGDLIEELGAALSAIAEASIFKRRKGEAVLLAVDEPAFSLIDDPLLDRGSEGRENLIRAWRKLLWKASSRGLETIIHLHATTDPLYLHVEQLDIVESHVDDPIYRDERAVGEILGVGKRVKASISRVDLDALIAERLGVGLDSPEATYKIGAAWSEVKRGSMRVELFLEDVELIRRRLKKIISRLGEENVPYAGPECGLRGFPSYESALENLRRVSRATSL